MEVSPTMARLSKKDVVIVGLGAAGGIASYVLAQAGLDVVGIEAGPRLSNKDFLKRLDEIGEDFSIRNSLGGPKFNREVPTWRPNRDTPTSAPIAVGMANCVGGSTVHFTAQYWRFLESDFAIHSETVKRYGTGECCRRARSSGLASGLPRPRALLRQGRVPARGLGSGWGEPIRGTAEAWLSEPAAAAVRTRRADDRAR